MASVFKQNTGIFYKCSGEDAFKPVIPFLTIFEDTKMNIWIYDKFKVKLWCFHSII